MKINSSVILAFLIGLSVTDAVEYDSKESALVFVESIFKNPSGLQETWVSYNSERRDPPGNYLFRFALDVRGDEQPEVFYAYSAYGDMNASAPSWMVLSERAGKDWQIIAESVLLPTSGFFVDRDNEKIFTYWPNFRNETGYLGTADFTEGFSTDRLEIGYYEANGLEALKGRIEELQAVSVMEYLPQIEKIPLGAFLHDPSLSWRPFDGRYAFEAQSLDVGDSDLLDLAGETSFIEAKSLLQNSNGEAVRKPKERSAASQGQANFREETKDQPLEDAEDEIESKRKISVTTVLLMMILVGWGIFHFRRARHNSSAADY